MPEYIYKNPDTGEQVSVIQSVHDNHTYEINGKNYDRVFTSPNASVDKLSQIDPNNSRDFIEKTKNKNMTYGEMWETSSELSSKRKAKEGKDRVKEKYFKKHSEKRHGLKHLKDN